MNPKVGEVVIVATGVANTAAVVAAFERLGARPSVTDDASHIREAPAAMLPGVGAFGAGRAALERTGAGSALSERIDAGRPTMAICLGLQLMCESSEESEGAGLGVIPGAVRRFPENVLSPQLGWNLVRAGAGAKLLTDGWAYFANSFRLAAPPAGFVPSMADHGGPFVAAVERGSFLACQFHPELSGRWGTDILRRWLTTAATKEAAAC